MEIEQKDRDRILLEERYRQEIRKQLAEPKSDSRIKQFVNSAFGLWLFSAIFISGAGTLYQNWQKQVDEDKAKFQKKLDEGATNREAISKLDVEISYRLSSGLLELSSVEERIDAQHAGKTDQERALLAAQATFGILRSLNSKERAIQDGLYPEFGSYTLATLLAELRRRLPESERADVETSLASLSSLVTRMHFKGQSAAPRQAAEALFGTVIRKRWQGTAFHYIDCNKKTPFC